MADRQERATRQTHPAARIGHDLRYRLAEPIVLGARSWADLACGTGVAAADVLGGIYPGRALLVDPSEEAAREAAARLAAAESVPVVADLTDRDALARLRATLIEGEGPRAVTCFDVVEHLTTFVPLVEMLSELAEAGEATVLLSVPNDELSAAGPPERPTAWGEGAFAELRSLLPEGAVVARQLVLQGSVVVPEGREGERIEVPVEAAAGQATPTHFIAAMGPEAAALGVHAAVAEADLDEQRAWERGAELARDEALPRRSS